MSQKLPIFPTVQRKNMLFLLPLLFQIVETIRFQYTNWTNYGNDEFNFASILNLIGDWQYKCPQDFIADTLADVTTLYKYKFGVRNPNDNWPNWTGVKHGDELDYVFGRPVSSKEEFNDEHFNLSKFIIEAWSNC